MYSIEDFYCYHIQQWSFLNDFPLRKTVNRTVDFGFPKQKTITEQEQRKNYLNG